MDLPDYDAVNENIFRAVPSFPIFSHP